MRNKKTYEWTIEVIKEGEIIDSSFYDNVKGNENEGLIYRLWAYVKNNKLPDYFTNDMNDTTSYKVPSKYHNELKKYLSS